MISNSWCEVSLGDLLQVKHGWSFKGDLFSRELTGRPIVVNIGNFQYTGGFRFDSSTIREYLGKYPKEFELSTGDILLVMTCQTEGGEILGIPGKIPNDGRIYLHNQRMGKVVITRPDLVSADFLYYVFTWKEFNQHLVRTASGTKIVHTSPGRIEQFRFVIPPIDEQRAIARILGALDDKIELNRQMNRTLEAMAQAIFKSWFVDFDPVTAKAEGRKPYGMSDEVAALFPSEFVTINNVSIPLGWELIPLDEIAEFENGLALQKYRPEGDDYLPAIKIRELRQGNSDGNSEKASPNIKTSCIIGDGDVIFSWSGSLMVDVWCGGKGALNQHLFKVTSNKFDKWFYYFWIKYYLPDFQDIAAGKATTMGHIQRHHLSSALVTVPTIEILDRANSLIEPLLDLLVANRIQNRSLASARDTLLPKLLSGEIRVKQAEQISSTSSKGNPYGRTAWHRDRVRADHAQAPGSVGLPHRLRHGAGAPA
jgi:type I restriction enzyme, S subunit